VRDLTGRPPADLRPVHSGQPPVTERRIQPRTRPGPNPPVNRRAPYVTADRLPHAVREWGRIRQPLHGQSRTRPLSTTVAARAAAA
jgi:hypothetical protein